MPKRYNGEYHLFLRTLSDKNCFAILINLLQNGEMGATKLQKLLGFKKPTIRSNLKKLSACDCVFSKMRGRERIYYVNTATIIPIMNTIERHINSAQRRG